MDALGYIGSFSRGGAPVRDLGRIRSLLAALGDPQEQLRFVHIAGTNGKGSIAEMLACSLTRAGYRTGLFTSPYIINFYDRIRLDGRCIAPGELEAVTEALRPAVDSHPLREQFSQFEITQAAAFLWYRQQGCDVVVLEAGLGGLLDSTNVITAPLVSAIGSIGLDHTAVLGDTIEKIAAQKAGIIKPGAPCVLSAGAAPEAEAVFREAAARAGSELIIPETSALTVRSCGLEGSSFSYKGRDYALSMIGEHQIRNALTAIEAAEVISRSLPVSYEALREGLFEAAIFGRVELLSREPLVILDGGHNPDAFRALSKALEAAEGRTIRAVIGMHTDKDAASSIGMIAPQVREFYPVSGFSDRDIPAERLRGIITSVGGRALRSGEDICALIRRLAAEHPDDVLLISGSLYLVAFVKQNLTFFG